jgi:membrane-bound lytic murein transglycosylase D
MFRGGVYHFVRGAEPRYAQAATQRYRIRRGDTLIRIARRHGTTVRALRQENGLRGSRIIAGRTLRIPAE